MHPFSRMRTSSNIEFSTLSVNILANCSGWPGRNENSITHVRLDLTVSAITAAILLSKRLRAMVKVLMLHINGSRVDGMVNDAIAPFGAENEWLSMESASNVMTLSPCSNEASSRPTYTVE